MTLGDQVRAGLLAGGVRPSKLAEADQWVRDGRVAVVDGRIAAFVSAGASIIDAGTGGSVLVDPERYAQQVLRAERPDFFSAERRQKPKLPDSLAELRAAGGNLTKLLAAVDRERPAPIAIPEHWAKDGLSARIIAKKNAALKA